jgi:hypothetical protein
LKHNVNVTQVLLASSEFLFFLNFFLPVDLPNGNAIFFTDERDPAFWSEVRAYGWAYFNHTEEQTLEKLGEWYLPIVDIVSHSLAIGFVGTVQSTFSLLSARRVDEWNNGSITYVTRS